MKLDYKSLKFQILSFLICVVLVVLVALTYSYQAIVDYNRTRYDEWCGQKLAAFETTFMEKYYRLSSIMTTLSYTELVQRVLLNTEEYSYEVSRPLAMTENIMRSMYAYSQLDGSIRDIYLLDAQQQMYSYVTYQQQREFGTLLKSIGEQPLQNTSGTFLMNGEPTFCLLAPIQRFDLNDTFSSTAKEVIGTCILTVNMEFIEQAMQSMARTDTTVYLLDPEGTVAAQYGSGEGDPAVHTALMSQLQDSGQTEVQLVQSDRHVATGKQIGSLGWRLVLVSPETARMFFNWGELLSLTLVWLFILIVMFVIGFRLLSGLNRFVSQLMTHMAIAGQGDLEVQMPRSEKTEFNRVASGFNAMIREIKQLTGQNVELSTNLYREEVERVNATLLALQSQINPHFLYNTIECIKNIGICYDVQEIEQLSTSLSFVLRYSMKKENMVTVSQEMECIEHYLQIQTIRFENRFSIAYDVDPALLNRPILKLCFEPLVENAMKHAFEAMPTDCRLTIRVYKEDRYLCLMVQDNGSGMSKEMVGRILEASADTGGSIGMSNVLRRLQLFYKDRAALVVESEEGCGTSVLIRIASWEEDQKVHTAVQKST